MKHAQVIYALMTQLATVVIGTIVMSITSGGQAAPNDDENTIQCATLIYGNNSTATCFSPAFLKNVRDRSHIRVSPKLDQVRLDADQLFDYPFIVMTGDGHFVLSKLQRKNLRDYLTRGGFIVASASCSDAKWNASFKNELSTVFGDLTLKPIELSHPIFSSIHKIRQLKANRASVRPRLWGLHIEGRLVMVYSPDGLNDTADAEARCCCCGGNEIVNARKLNANLLGYAVTH